MKRKTKLKILRILFVISLIISLFLISDIYARYQEQVNTSYQSSIKRWKIKVNNEAFREKTSLNEIVTPSWISNPHIKNDVIVPGREGYFEFDIDYSQVDVPFKVDLELNQISSLEDFERYAFVVNDGVTYNNASFYDLPAGYKQVEYIESTGTQYIDTGFKPNQNTRVIMDYQLTEVASVFLFGTRANVGQNAYTINVSSGNIVSAYGTENPTNKSIGETANTERHIVDKNKNKVYYDGNLKLTHENTLFTCTNSLQLFAARHGAVSGYLPSKTKLYSVKIYDNDVITREFVPCYKEGTGGSVEKVGLYDVITKTFYANKAAGDDFVIPKDAEGKPIVNDFKDIILNKDTDTQNETNIKAYIRWVDSTENRMDNTEDTAFVIDPSNIDVEYEATIKFEQYIEE